MSHLDDDLIAELIDGELDAAARAAATAHLAACAECRARHAEALSYSGESDRLIAAVGLPRPLRPLRSSPALSPRQLPRRTPWRAIGWAASIVLAAGLGYYAGVPAPGAQLETADPGSVANRQEAAAGAGGAALAVESAASPRQEAALPAQPAPSAPAEAKALRQFGDERDKRPAPGEAPPAAAALPGRDHLQPLPVRPGVSAPKLEQGGRIQSPARETEAAPPGKVLALETAGAAPAVSMEEAIARLGGSIRLIDGMAPVAVRFLAGSGEPAAGDEAVRVIYRDPPARELWLDQRRIGAADKDANDEGAFLIGDTIGTILADGRRSLQWRDAGGFRLFLSGFLSADSLQVLARRVR